MEAILIKALNMSISATWLILAVLLLRLLLKKAPKWFSVVLWGFVGLRLVLPFSLQSVFSLIPSAEVVSPSIGYAQHPAINSGISVIDNAVNPTLGSSLAATPMNSVNPMQIILYLGGIIWMVGIAILLLYGLISYLRLRRKVAEAIPYEKNTWLCDQVKTPFILGVFRPRIYLPSGLNEEETAYVLAHEHAHLKRKDHLWKPLGFLLLTVYWFNPLVWVAYILLCRDIEAACDEKVISDMAMTEKKAYANALVSCSLQRRLILACPLAFGEVGVKERVKGVLNYKKPAFWIILVALLAGIVTAVCFLTVPKKDKTVTISYDGSPTLWFDDWDYGNNPDDPVSVKISSFSDVTFRGTVGGIEAIENGKTRTLFAGMPVWSVYFTDLTGDGKPDLCATVSFGSGIVDEHIIVYDYVRKQSYVLWDRMQFDFHLYTVDGALYVGKTPYMGDKQVDSGTLVMHDGVLCCRWHSDGSFTPLNRELHESELYGEWLVEEERDANDNVLYTRSAELWKEYNFREDGTVTYNETVPVSSDSELAFGHPVEYPYEVHNGYVYIAGDDTSGAFRWGYYDRETHRLTLSYNTAERTVNQTLKRMGEPEPSQKPYIGSWELFKIVDGAQEYDTSFLAAAGGIESDTLVLSEDGTGIRTTAIKGYETNEIALTFTPEQDETVLNVVFSESYAYGDVMTARYDSENDTISLYYPDDPTMYTVYIRSGSVIDAPTSKLTIDMLVGNWETEGNTAYDPPFLPGTLTFNKNGSAVLWLKDFLRSGEAIEYTVSLDGNMIWFADQTFASYDPNTDTIRLRLPLQSAGTLVFSRVSPSAEATPEPAKSSDLSKEQADAFVNGLSVEFEDGAPYGCDLVCYIDGFGECLNIDDPEAYKSASLRFEPTEERIKPTYPHFTYAKILCVEDQEYYLGNIRLSKSDDQMQKYEFRDNDRSGIDASIFVPVDSSMMERNRACPERVCVIKAFDTEKREVTISFAELDEPEEDGYPATVNYDAVEEETYTFRVTDDTMLSLIVDYQALVKPDRFFKYLEAFGWMYLYTDSDDPGVGFWIGIDGDTLLYLCEVYEE